MSSIAQTSLEIVVKWLAQISAATKHGANGQPSKERLATYAEFLLGDLPSAAFNADSLRFALDGVTWFPAADALRSTVAAHWNAHKPRSARRIADRETENLDDMARRWVAYFRKREVERFCSPHPGGDPSSRERCLSLIRSQSWSAWQFLTTTPAVGRISA